MRTQLIAISLVIAICCTKSTPATATDPFNVPGPGWVAVGLGVFSCGSYLDALHATPPVAPEQMSGLQWQGKTYYAVGSTYVQWLAGYVSGANGSRPQGNKQIAVDISGISNWVKKYCENHAAEPLAHAAAAFVMEQQNNLR